MTRNRGCFDRHDDEHNTPHEYASPPCYMHEVDPAYFGSLPLAFPASDSKSDDHLEDGVPMDARASWTTLLGSALSRVMNRITSLTGSKDRD